jgi:hypothetical protein
MPRHFFIAGAQRCATTYLYRMLEQHPDITMARPVRPEPKYFLRPDIPDSADAYRDEFFPGASTAWLGEKSTSYIERPLAAERIARMFPDAEVIFLLRDPVRRAISNHRFSCMHGLETLPLEEALAAEDGRGAVGTAANTSVSPFAYVGRGHYARQLDAWAAWFPRERMHVMTTERLVANTRETLRPLFDALGLELPATFAGTGEAVNASDQAQEAAPGVVQSLRAAFAESNADLARRYGVDLGDWL